MINLKLFEKEKPTTIIERSRSCYVRTDEIELNCNGYTKDEVVDMLKTLINCINNSTNDKINEVMKETIRETFDEKHKGDLDEFVSTEGKDVEIVNLERTLKTAKLPSCTSDFSCPDCKQSVLLKVDDIIVVRDIKYNKVYNVGKIKLPFVTKENIIDVYKDCIGLIERTKDYILVANSEDECSCPVCNYISTISEFVNNYEDNNNCDFCGLEKENVITQSGEHSDCINKCSMKLSN